jgi:hypothetical protein
MYSSSPRPSLSSSASTTNEESGLPRTWLKDYSLSAAVAILWFLVLQASREVGVVIDVSLFCEVTPSEDESNVAIGAGAKWLHVSKVLDARDLAVIGSRNSAVGVGA